LFLLRHAVTLPFSSSHHSPHLGYNRKNERLSNQIIHDMQHAHIL
jgi:hypothetical protein